MAVSEERGNSLLEFALVATLVGVVVWSFVSGFHSQTEAAINSEKDVFNNAEVLDLN